MAITRHQYRIFIKAPIEQVWNALLDPAFTRRYFHGTAFARAATAEPICPKPIAQPRCRCGRWRCWPRCCRPPRRCWRFGWP